MIRFKNLFFIFLILSLSACFNKKTETSATEKKQAPLVLLTDFGVKDGAVSAMKGVAYQVSEDLLISDLTHEIPPYNIWEASYRLMQTMPYWSNSVFVIVVDPGVGSERKSIVAKTESGHLLVGPDNGFLTLVHEIDPIVEVRNIDEKHMRLKGSEESYTFHGRDLYAYVGAQLASRKLQFTESGEKLKSKWIRIDYQKAELKNARIQANIPILDPNFGNIWTNIPKDLLQKSFPEAKTLQVTIKNKGVTVYQAQLPLAETFAQVKKSEPLIYFNSLLYLSLALNQDDFAKTYHIQSGPDWSIIVEP